MGRRENRPGKYNDTVNSMRSILSLRKSSQQGQLAKRDPRENKYIVKLILDGLPTSGISDADDMSATDSKLKVRSNVKFLDHWTQ